MDGDNFSNHQIASETLPDIGELAFEPVSPAYRKLNLSILTIIVVVVLLAISVVRFQPFATLPDDLIFAYPFIAGGVVLLGSLIFTYIWHADKRIMYAIREQDLSLRKGLIFRSMTCQPILRVQHIELKRGPLDRAAGLAKLQVFSAGGAGHTFEVPGLPVAKAQKLRQYILDHKDVGAR